MGLFVILCLIGFGFSLAHLADREEDSLWRMLGSVALGVLWLLAAFLGALMTLATTLGDALRTGDPALDQALKRVPMDPEQAGQLVAAVMGGIPLIGQWILALAVVALILILPWPRRLLAKVIPIDPDRLVHTMALHGALVMVIFAAATAIFVNLVIDLMSAGGGAEVAKELADATTLGSLWAQQLGFVALAFLGVGLFVTRGWRESAARLGLLGGFSWRWFLATVATGIVLALLVQGAWQRFFPESQEAVESLSEMLFGPLVRAGLLGALTIGLSAGLGEEILFRGAMQPRLGLVLTSLLFAVIHTQYGVTPALVQILALGLLLGLVRQRAGTLTAIAAHAVYNFIFVMAAVIGGQVPLWQGGPTVPIPDSWKPTPTAQAAPAEGTPPALGAPTEQAKAPAQAPSDAGGLALALDDGSGRAGQTAPAGVQVMTSAALQAASPGAAVLRATTDRLDYAFAERLEFRLEAELPGELQQVLLRYTIGEDTPRNRRVPAFQPGGRRVEARHEEDLVRGAIPPASTIRWWWTVVLADGRLLETQPQETPYLDERFDWQSLEDADLRVWWYGAPRDFAVDIAGQAEAALDRLAPLIGSRPDRRVEIVTYQNQADLRNAMFNRGEGYEERLSTLGARVAPDILILDAGTGGPELEEVIAHELSHIVLNLHYEEAYVDAPLWLDEGLAMYVEGPLDGGEQRALDRAVAADKVMSVRSLTSFPGNPDQVELAYAQSQDLVAFLIETGGEERFRRLLAEVGQGEADIDAILKDSYGFDQLGLYQAWRTSKGLPTAATPQPGAPPRALERPAPVSGAELPCGPALWLPLGLVLAAGQRGRRKGCVG